MPEQGDKRFDFVTDWRVRGAALILVGLVVLGDCTGGEEETSAPSAYMHEGSGAQETLSVMTEPVLLEGL